MSGPMPPPPGGMPMPNGPIPMPFPPPPGFRPGQQPTPEQLQAMQQQFTAEAARQGLTPQQFAEKLRAHAMAQRQAQMAQQGQMQGQQGQGQGQGGADGQQGQQMPPSNGQIPPGARPMMMPPPGSQMAARPGQQVPIVPGPPKPEALAVAKFLRAQNLKTRPCIFQEKRKDLFKVKRAIRALQSPAYEKARKKNPLLPEVTDRASAENTFKMLPISMLALRVSKLDPENDPGHGQPGHQHGGRAKGPKGQKLWTVRIEQQQEAADEFHYVWFYEGTQWRLWLYAIGLLVAVMAVVLFPLWPYALRRGVYYLSMASIGILVAFFALAIVRLIIFLLTILVGPKPGIWIFPNLFEDVGFFDSFKPTWAWRETTESLAIVKAEKKAKRVAKRNKRLGITTPAASNDANSNSNTLTDGAVDVSGDIGESEGKDGGMTTGLEVGGAQRRVMHARVEELGDEEE